MKSSKVARAEGRVYTYIHSRERRFTDKDKKSKDSKDTFCVERCEMLCRHCTVIPQLVAQKMYGICGIRRIDMYHQMTCTVYNKNDVSFIIRLCKSQSTKVRCNDRMYIDAIG